jgi:hypothetical protein
MAQFRVRYQPMVNKQSCANARTERKHKHHPTLIAAGPKDHFSHAGTVSIIENMNRLARGIAKQSSHVGTNPGMIYIGS